MERAWRNWWPLLMVASVASVGLDVIPSVHFLTGSLGVDVVASCGLGSHRLGGWREAVTGCQCWPCFSYTFVIDYITTCYGIKKAVKIVSFCKVKNFFIFGKIF